MESIGEVIVMVAPRSPTDAADRAVLAAAAAWALGLDPASVRVCRRCPHCGSAEHGVPSLAAVTSGSAPHPTVHLSLSRASGHVAVAVSFAGPVGVDVESVDAVARSPSPTSPCLLASGRRTPQTSPGSGVRRRRS
ncbi:hypothetical protein [Cryobacterium sp. 10C3]|uniref:hypothetical protein n=1 Tax=Cryobacterium sp. 10C3 TaxID=3048577 RepID=UPI002AB361D7|nr:hypothetical protein [Cryobacterium sp. 10C3]MDY7555459.1 hypothetical protein [Cryobacterium sp. 10C3]